MTNKYLEKITESSSTNWQPYAGAAAGDLALGAAGGLHIEKTASGGWSEIGPGIHYHHDSGRYQIDPGSRSVISNNLDSDHRTLGAKVMGASGLLAGSAMGIYRGLHRPEVSVPKSATKIGAGLGVVGALAGYGLAVLGNKQYHDFVDRSGRDPRVDDYIHDLAGHHSRTSGAYLTR